MSILITSLFEVLPKPILESVLMRIPSTHVCSCPRADPSTTYVGILSAGLSWDKPPSAWFGPLAFAYH